MLRIARLNLFGYNRALRRRAHLTPSLCLLPHVPPFLAKLNRPNDHCMSKHSNTSAPQTAVATESAPADGWPVLAPSILFGVVLICYWVQLTSSGVSILWDAADFFQPIQNYLSQELRAGRIPLGRPFPSPGSLSCRPCRWAPGIRSTGRSFSAGVTPRLLLAENFLHVAHGLFRRLSPGFSIVEPIGELNRRANSRYRRGSASARSGPDYVTGSPAFSRSQLAHAWCKPPHGCPGCY